jgi:hypothetical protein
MRYFLVPLFTGICFLGWSQAPQFINYQGVARDGAGVPVINRSISLKFEILQGTATGSVVYTDLQEPAATTNALGLFNTRIGRNGTLGSINWQAGPYFLRISIDTSGGSNYTPLGAQEIVSVPYALATPPPALTYSGNLLTVNGSTVNIAQAAAITVSGGTNVSVTGGPDYTVTSTPTLNLAGNSLSIAGGNAVALPVTNMTGAGIASVVPAAGTDFTVNVPAPVYSPVTGVLTMGSATALVSPPLVFNNSILTSGPVSNSVIIPAGVTVAGSGMVNVAGAPNYTVSAIQPSLQLSPNNVSLSITGGNTVTLPAAFPQTTVTGTGIASAAAFGAGTNSFNVNVPLPTYAPLTGILSFGSQVAAVIPTLMISGSTISVGPASNSVSLSGSFPWAQSTGAVTLSTGSDRIGIGSNAAAPSAKLDVQGESSLTVPVIKANNINSANSAAALDVSSAGSLAMQVTSSNAGGIGGSFSSTGGIALKADNNSPFYTFQATNSNALSSSYAGYFDGGFVARGKGGATNLVLSARNSSVDVFVIRNDGNVGIGTSTPTQKLEVAGSVKITDGTEGAGKALISDATGNASWQPLTLVTTAAFSGHYLPIVSATPTNFSTPIGTFNKVNADTKVSVTVQTHVTVQDMNGLNAVRFEVLLGANSAVASTGRVSYFKDNGGSSSTDNYLPVTIIAEFAAGLPAAAYNVNISVVGVGGAGTASDIYLDPGNYGASSVIIKEYR